MAREVQPLKQTTLRRPLLSSASTPTRGGKLGTPVSTPTKNLGLSSPSRGGPSSTPSLGGIAGQADPPSRPATSDSFEDQETPTNCKVWVNVLGPDGQEQRVRVEKVITTADLRKAVKIKTGVPIPELELKVGDEVLMEGLSRPFLRAATSELSVHWRRVDRLKSLLDQRNLSHLNSMGKFDRTALHFAVLDGDVDLCTRIVDHRDRQPGLINVRDVFHDTPLMLASILGYAEIVEMLVDRQAFLDCQNLCGRTALQMAAEHGHKKVVKALLQDNASLGKAPPRLGPMGRTIISRSAPYLAELNERHQAQHRIKVYKLSKRAQPGLDF